jgi:hypothetical protein
VPGLRPGRGQCSQVLPILWQPGLNAKGESAEDSRCCPRAVARDGCGSFRFWGELRVASGST